MIQDIGPMKFYNQYRNEEVMDNDEVLCFFERGILAKELDELEYPTYGQLRKDLSKEKCVYLFSLDDRKFFLGNVREKLCLEGYGYRKLNDIRKGQKKEMVLVAATGWHLFCWYDNNRFCGRCGQQTRQDDKERMLRCSCGNMIFPKIAPAVIVGITDGNRLLLTKYANRTYKKYALVAGFTEIGETVEETVSREVMEEVGLRVKNIRYYKSQPWGFDSNVLMGFFCDVDGDASITREEEELAVAEWVNREDVPDYMEGLSLTHEMMKVFREGKI